MAQPPDAQTVNANPVAAPDHESAARLLRDYGWPAWLSLLANGAMTFYVAGSVLIGVVTAVGVWMAAVSHEPNIVAIGLYVLLAMTVVGLALIGYFGLHNALAAYNRMCAPLPPEAAPLPATPRGLWTASGLNRGRLDTLNRIAIALLTGGAVGAGLSLYWIYLLPMTLPDGIIFLLLYIGFIGLSGVAALVGGASLLAAVRTFRALGEDAQDAS